MTTPSRRLGLLGAALVGLGLLLLLNRLVGLVERVVWEVDSAEYTVASVVILLGGAALAVFSDRGGPRWGGAQRLVLYVIATVVLMAAAFLVGVARFEATHCSAPGFDGECDVAVLDGMAWAAVAMLVALLVVAVLEGVRRNRRRAA